MRVNCMVTDIEDAVPINSGGVELLAWGKATLEKPKTGSRAGHRPTDDPHVFTLAPCAPFCGCAAGLALLSLAFSRPVSGRRNDASAL